jgi:hypothetical protein
MLGMLHSRRPDTPFTNRTAIALIRRALGPARKLRATARIDADALLGPAQHSMAVRVG